MREGVRGEHPHSDDDHETECDRRSGWGRGHAAQTSQHWWREQLQFCVSCFSLWRECCCVPKPCCDVEETAASFVLTKKTLFFQHVLFATPCSLHLSLFCGREITFVHCKGVCCGDFMPLEFLPTTPLCLDSRCVCVRMCLPHGTRCLWLLGDSLTHSLCLSLWTLVCLFVCPHAHE